MKIIRTIESFYPVVTGPANQAFMISSRLEERGIESPVFTTLLEAPDAAAEERINGVSVKRFPVRLKYMRYAYSPAFREALNSQDFDIMHAHNYRSYQTDAAFKAARRKDRPFVLHAHGSLLGYRSITQGLAQYPYRLYDLLTRKGTALQADAVIVSSGQELTEAAEFGAERVHKIPMGIEQGRYYRPREPDNDTLDLLFVGRICKDRNIMPILKALESLNDRNIRLTVVGGAAKRSSTEKPGYLEMLKGYSEQRGLNVEFKGMLKGKELISAYRSADAFIYTSLWENFGQTLLEAAATGLPIISTPVGIAPEIVANNKTGYLVDSNNTGRIAEAINMLKDKRKRHVMGRNIAMLVKRNFGWEDVMMQYEKLYLSLVERFKARDK